MHAHASVAICAQPSRSRPRLADGLNYSVSSPALELQSNLAAELADSRRVSWPRLAGFTLFAATAVMTCGMFWLSTANLIFRAAAF